MTTKTTQSGATLGFPEGRGLIPSVNDRGTVYLPFAQPHPRKPSHFFLFWHQVGIAEILIANARLEFNVTHSKENPLKISNRERIAISHPRFEVLTQKGGVLQPARRRYRLASHVKRLFPIQSLRKPVPSPSHATRFIPASSFERPASRT
jgi:hypothetical protein